VVIQLNEGDVCKRPQIYQTPKFSRSSTVELVWGSLLGNPCAGMPLRNNYLSNRERDRNTLVAIDLPTGSVEKYSKYRFGIFFSGGVDLFIFFFFSKWSEIYLFTKKAVLCGGYKNHRPSFKNI